MRVRGTVAVPGDKSISHRSLICASLARGVSYLRGVLDSADVNSTAEALRALGVEISPLGATCTVRGRGLRELAAPRDALDCGNSGTTARLLAGVVAGHPFAARFVGDASLSRRPMGRVARPLVAMGAGVEFEAGERLPMTVRGGPLAPLAWESEAASAQVKSAILLAGLVGGVPVTVREPVRSRDHTERMLAALGAAVSVQDTEVSLVPPVALAPLDATVPGDPSSASFFAALAACAGAGVLLLPNVCLNETRVGFFHALRRMGARVDFEDCRSWAGETIGTIRAEPGALVGIEVGHRDVPSMIDELPLLACLGARAEGETVIAGAAELRLKESDRIAAVVENLRALGVDAEERPDGLRVLGSARTLRGRVRTHGDHRLAMAFGVLGAIPGNDVALDDRECVAVSYPGFWRDLEAAVAAD
jgi:3-phosphoshikimate 1-carboxyvinyltransferase